MTKCGKKAQFLFSLVEIAAPPRWKITSQFDPRTKKSGHPWYIQTDLICFYICLWSWGSNIKVILKKIQTQKMMVLFHWKRSGKKLEIFSTVTNFKIARYFNAAGKVFISVWTVHTRSSIGFQPVCL